MATAASSSSHGTTYVARSLWSPVLPLAWAETSVSIWHKPVVGSSLLHDASIDSNPSAMKSTISNFTDSESTVQPLGVAVELDVPADRPTIKKAVQRAWHAFGRIDGLINNVGIRGEVKFALDLSEEEREKDFRTNSSGQWLVSKYVCTLMRDSRTRGSVINISSIAGAGRGQVPGGVAYSSSKSGLVTMTKVLAIELGTHHIRFNSISPGLFKSEITQSQMEKEWINNVAKRASPLRTYGTTNPTLTPVIRYLIHDGSHYV